MSPTRFTFVLPSGVSVTGPVRGCGGMVGAPRLRKAQRISATGRAHGLFEPTPGCVAVFHDYCAEEDGGSIAVPLASLVLGAGSHRHDFRDGDVCSTCDQMRSAS